MWPVAMLRSAILQRILWTFYNCGDYEEQDRWAAFSALPEMLHGARCLAARSRQNVYMIKRFQTFLWRREMPSRPGHARKRIDNIFGGCAVGP